MAEKMVQRWVERWADLKALWMDKKKVELMAVAKDALRVVMSVVYQAISTAERLVERSVENQVVCQVGLLDDWMELQTTDQMVVMMVALKAERLAVDLVEMSVEQMVSMKDYHWVEQMVDCWVVLMDQQTVP